MLKQISKILSGSAIGQLIGFILIPILTHLYSPKVFGEYQVAFSAAVFIAIVLTYKLEIAIPTIEANQVVSHIKNILKVLSINLVILALLCFALLNLTSWLPESLNSTHLFVFTFAIGVLIAVNNIGRFYLIEKQKFGTISATLFLQSGGRSGFQWLLSFLPNLGLLIGDIIARLAMVILLLKEYFYNKNEDSKNKSLSLASTMKKHWRYPVWVLPSVLMNSSMGLLLLPVVAIKFGIAEAGILAVAYRILTAPNSLIGAALSDVIFARFSEMKKQGQYKAIKILYLKTSAVLFVLSISGFSLLYVLSQYAHLVLSEEYLAASGYMQIMVIWFACQFIISPLSRIIFVYDKQVYKLIFDVAVFMALLWVSYWQSYPGLPQMLSELTIVMSLLYLIYYMAVTFMVVRQE